MITDGRADGSMLTLSGLRAGYGGKPVLQGVELTVERGTIAAVIGRNGVGKSTLMKTLIGLLPAMDGTVSFEGRDMRALKPHQRAHLGIGYVPEERGIFSTLTVEENLTLPPVIAKGGMSLAEIYQLFPNLEERRKSPGTKLSGGEQQMLAMARILRTGARLLLLDEPTEGLAPVIIQRIGEVLQTLKQRGMTILLVEQNFRFASKVADRFYVVDHGQVIDTFDVADLPGRMSMLNEALGV